jgi:hypothetical protein
MNNSYVYMLIDPRNNQPFYVGKGVGDRCYFHLDEAKYYKDRKSLKLGKIRKLFSLGLEPIIKKVEENVSDEQAIELECFLISEIRDFGILLTNMTDGGDGAKGYRHTEEHKLYMSSTQKNRVISEETKQKMRRPKSEEGRKNIAEARKNSTYKPSEETKRKVSMTLMGRPSPMRGVRHSDEAKAKMSAQRKGVPKPKVECTNCQRSIAINVAKRWHFDNCKGIKNV